MVYKLYELSYDEALIVDPKCDPICLPQEIA